MSDQKKSHDSRGWSLVFKDGTKAQPGGDSGDLATVVDQEMSPEFREELKRLKPSVAVSSPPKNILPPAGAAADPEITMDDRGSALLVRELEDFDQTMTDGELSDPFIEQTVSDAMLDEPPIMIPTRGPPQVISGPSPAIEPARPEAARAETPEPPPDAPLEDLERTFPDDAISPLKNVQVKNTGDVPEVHKASAERTMIDVAAALGIAPSTPSESRESAELPPEQPEAALPVERIDLEPLLPSAQELQSPPAQHGPAEGLDGAKLQHIAATAQSTSKVLPMVLGVMLLVLTVAAFTMLFGGGSGRTEHVELHFLATDEGLPRLIPPDAELEPSRLFVETVPEGLIVLYNGKILGTTPTTFELPVSLPNRAGIQLRGPYFSTWVSEIDKNSLGEFHIRATLERK